MQVMQVMSLDEKFMNQFKTNQNVQIQKKYETDWLSAYLKQMMAHKEIWWTTCEK